MIGCILVVIRDDPEGLESEFANGLAPPDAFNEQNQTVELVLGYLSLCQHQRLIWCAKNASLARPFSNQKTKFLHGRALRFDVRRSGRLGD